MIDSGTVERFAFFRQLDSDGREALATRMRRKRFRKGDALIRLLEKADRIHLVLEGLAAREAVSVNGVRRIGWVYRPGDLIGSRALLDMDDDGEVRALTDVEAAVLAVGEMNRVGERHPEVGLAVARILTGRLEGMAERLLAATTLGVESRLARLLLEFASDAPGEEGFRPLAYAMTHETMAEIVGASRPHVSAMIGEMEERGALRRGRGGRLVVHPERLDRLIDSEGLDPT